MEWVPVYVGGREGENSMQALQLDTLISSL